MAKYVSLQEARL